MSINKPESGSLHNLLDTAKGFLREAYKEAYFLRSDWKGGIKPELGLMAGDLKLGLICKFTKGGKRFNNIDDLAPENRWTSETLKNTEAWVYDQTGDRERAILYAYFIWFFNGFHIKQRYGVTKDLAVSGKPVEEGGVQLVIRHPELLAEDPRVTNKMVRDFQLEISGNSPKVREDIAVRPLYIGDGIPALDFLEKAVETSKKEGEQFLGIYKDNLLADLEHTFNRQMLNVLIDSRSHLSSVPLRTLIGRRGDLKLRNLLTHMWNGETLL